MKKIMIAVLVLAVLLIIGGVVGTVIQRANYAATIENGEDIEEYRTRKDVFENCDDKEYYRGRGSRRSNDRYYSDCDECEENG
jgi:uncharacterized protein YxeA